MTRDDIRATVLRVLGDIAPEADLAALRPDRELRDELDLDSMDILNAVIALHRAARHRHPRGRLRAPCDPRRRGRVSRRQAGRMSATRNKAGGGIGGFPAEPEPCEGAGKRAIRPPRSRTTRPSLPLAVAVSSRGVEGQAARPAFGRWRHEGHGPADGKGGTTSDSTPNKVPEATSGAWSDACGWAPAG